MSRAVRYRCATCNVAYFVAGLSGRQSSTRCPRCNRRNQFRSTRTVRPARQMAIVDHGGGYKPKPLVKHVEPKPRVMLASDAEREQCVRSLQAAYEDGRLTVDEFDWRSERAYAARYASALTTLTQDIPKALPAPQEAAQRLSPKHLRHEGTWKAGVPALASFTLGCMVMAYGIILISLVACLTGCVMIIAGMSYLATHEPPPE